MADVYTNVQDLKYGVVTIDNVKSITVDEDKGSLEGQSDGARQPSVVGTLGTSFTISIDLEDTGVDLGPLLGDCDGDSIVFKTSLDCAPATLKTHTVTNIILTTQGLSTDQGAPNTRTLTGRNLSQSSTWSIA